MSSRVSLCFDEPLTPTLSRRERAIEQRDLAVHLLRWVDCTPVTLRPYFLGSLNRVPEHFEISPGEGGAEAPGEGRDLFRGSLVGRRPSANRTTMDYRLSTNGRMRRYTGKCPMALSQPPSTSPITTATTST